MELLFRVLGVLNALRVSTHDFIGTEPPTNLRAGKGSEGYENRGGSAEFQALPRGLKAPRLHKTAADLNRLWVHVTGMWAHDNGRAAKRTRHNPCFAPIATMRSYKTTDAVKYVFRTS